MAARLVSAAEVMKHHTVEDCWVVIHGKVYDVTQFLPDHPGGVNVIAKNAGRDATKAFDPIHPKDVLTALPAEAYIGDIDPSSVHLFSLHTSTPANEEASAMAVSTKPPIEHMINVSDFESVAQNQMTKEAWDYYCSGADDEITLRENRASFQRYWLCPRVLVDVSSVDVSTKLLGFDSSFPLYISATALGKLAHPDGELALARAAHSLGIIQMVPTLGSYSLDEMLAARQPNQIQFLQLYVNRNRQLTLDIIRKAEKAGCKALAITVDAPQLGRREKDMRNKFTAQAPSVQKKDSLNRAQGTARAISSFIDPSLSWKDIKWFRENTKMKIILKGVQVGQDAVLAAQHGVDGIIVSNHGGRQLDLCRTGIDILPEVMSALDSINARERVEVFVDGGVRRGTDIFKAIALGAKGVGIGRPALWGLAAYGQDGVERVLELLREEFRLAMMLMGTPSVADIKREMVTRHVCSKL
eukprot:GILK01006755.1.p1 GENE.GILK01006755.1~~GILK01006755.1.p1  ORF type:complete len:471 (-),score=82.87 GILK01006755.1:292-1704(-)